MIEDYLEDPPPEYPWGRWRTEAMNARRFLESSTVQDTEVEMVAELQVMLSEYLQGRKASHLMYKVVRAANPDALYNDFKVGETRESKTYEEDFERRKQTQDLVWAAGAGDLDVVELRLAETYVDVNEATEDGYTGLFCAAQNGYADVVKRFVADDRVDINKACDDGHIPFTKACENGHLEVVKILAADQRLNINYVYEEDGTTALFFASQEGYNDIAELLLADERVDVSQTMTIASRHSPLTIAAYFGHADVCATLVEHGADRGYEAQPKDDEPYRTAGGTAAAIAQERGHTIPCL